MTDKITPTPIPKNAPRSGEIWEHKETGNDYFIVCTGWWEPDPTQIVVCYRNRKRQTWIRPYVEFMNRFRFVREKPTYVPPMETRTEDGERSEDQRSRTRRVRSMEQDRAAGGDQAGTPRPEHGRTDPALSAPEGNQ